MTTTPIYIPDIIGENVVRVQAKLLAQFQAIDPTIVGINYQYGPYKEVFDNIVQMTKSNVTSVKKYPLVWLVMPTFERMSSLDMYTVSPIRMIIARWGNKTDKTPTRYEKNFKPFLYPIYLELLNQFYLDKRIMSRQPTDFSHTKIDWPYWGGDQPTTDENLLSDYVDAIEIKNLELKINLKNC